MITVEMTCFRSNGRTPSQKFIVKDKKKIEFWKALEGVGYYWDIKIK